MCSEPVKGSLGFPQTIKTSKVDRWFGLIGNQDHNWTKGMSFIAMEPHFGRNPDCFDYKRNTMNIQELDQIETEATSNNHQKNKTLHTAFS